MAKDLLHLTYRMQRVAKGIERAVDLTTKDAANLALFEVLLETPVDTGAARSNYTVGIGGPLTSVRRSPFAPIKSRWKPRPGAFPGGTKAERGNLQAALALGRSKIAGRKPDEPIYIQNLAPYIGRLNRGYSPQSGAGFVALAVAKTLPQITRRAVFYLKREIER